MKLKELVKHIEIDPTKLTQYSLNKNHEKGRNKAIMFEQHLGFTQENHQLLLAQIKAKAMEAEVTLGYYDDYGQRCNVDLWITGLYPEQKEIVRTGWLVNPEKRIARLITVFIRST